MARLHQVIRYSIDRIKENDIETLKEFAEDPNYKTYLDAPYVFNQLFNNACLYQKLEIIKWLYEIYKKYGYVERSGIRPTFCYCYHQQKNETIKSYLRKIVDETKT